MASKSKASDKTDSKTSAAPAKAAGESKAGQGLYVNVALLNSNAHGKLKVRPGKDVKFAASLNSVILAAAEFPQAAVHYPVVFSEQNGQWQAFGVLGPRDGTNTFVNKDGKWTEGVYVPAFVRRYPFILVEDKEKQNLSLAADMNSDMINEKEGQPIYEDGKPSKAADNIMKFCVSFHQQLAQTGDLIKRMAEAGILASKTADVNLPDGTKSRLVGFYVVDEKALRELSDADFVKLRQDGLLNLIYCQLWSMRSWNNILA